MEGADMSSIFLDYKHACMQKLSHCLSLEDKVMTLESFVDELMEQNELLINTIVELQKEAANRSKEMEKRLNISASRTEEVVLAMNKYEKDIKKMVNDRIFDVDAADMLEELNSHIVAINIENNFLRDQNENLKHDLGNLIVMMKSRMNHDQNCSHDQNCGHDQNCADANCNDHRTNECLTFCHVDPEDIFGPIEAIISNGCSVDEGVQVELDVELEDKPSDKLDIKLDSRTLSRSSSVSNHNKFIVEEKEVLISKLQEHLHTLSNELSLKDEVVKNLEIKLNSTRKENADFKAALAQFNQKYEECDQRLQEAIERVSVMNEQKQSLMIQLDEESEQRIKFKEELKSLQARLLENMKTVENQSITIQHLREAIVTKSKSDSTQINGISSHSSLTDF